MPLLLSHLHKGGRGSFSIHIWSKTQDLPGRCWVAAAAGWPLGNTRVLRVPTLVKPAGPSQSAATRAEQRSHPDLLHLSCLQFNTHPSSPCWSGLGEACSRWCRGRGTCWVVKRPGGPEPPALARWRPAGTEAAPRWGRPQRSATRPRPGLLLPLGRTHAGRTPGGHEGEMPWKKNKHKNEHLSRSRASRYNFVSTDRYRSRPNMISARIIHTVFTYFVVRKSALSSDITQTENHRQQL